MSLRTRLSVLSLEERANPSGPELLDPYTTGGTTPVVTTPTAPDTTTITQIAIAVATGTTGTTTGGGNALNDTNSIYNTPMIP